MTSIENYREKLFNLIPSLTYLDGFDKDDKEAEEEDSSSEQDDDDDEANDIDGSDGEYLCITDRLSQHNFRCC